MEFSRKASSNAKTGLICGSSAPTLYTPDQTNPNTRNTIAVTKIARA
jgi:hypothetical protein